MVVVHLTASRFFGGPERQMLELAKALPSEIRSVFVSFAETGLCQAFLDKVRQDGFEAIALRHDTPRLLAALRELVSVLRRVGADVVCCHGYKAGLLGLLAARRLGIPAIAVSRGWTGECARVRLYEALDRRVLRWMDKVVCVSEGQAAKVRRAGVRPDKITVIHNAIRPERFGNPDPVYREQLRRMFGAEKWSVVSGQWSEGGKGDRSILPERPSGCCAQNGPVPFSGPDIIVGAAGRLSPEKGFDVLIDAAAEVLKSSPHIPCAAPTSHAPRPSPLAPLPSIGFVLFGDGPLRESLARQIAARGLEGKFILAGFRSDFDHFLPHLDLMVLPSFSEGLPNVALESLAAGVPVVATAVGGTPEVIEDGLTGYLVPPGDPAALAERMISVLSDRAIRTRFAAQGRDSVARQFSFDTQAHSYVQLFEKLIPSPPATEQTRGQDMFRKHDDLISIIIPSYNRADDLRHCLFSIKSQVYKLFEVIVVDDGSTDHTGPMMKEEFAEFGYIRSRRTLGPSYARNVGIDNSSGKFILFLDSDARLQRTDILECFLRFFDEHLRAGMVGGQIDAVNSPTHLVEGRLITLFGDSRALRIPAVTGSFAACDYLATCCCMVRREVVERIGGFDPLYGFGAEDKDLGYRVRMAGYENYLSADCSAEHYHSTTGRSDHETFLYIKTRMRFVLKCLPRHRRLLSASFWLCYVLLFYPLLPLKLAVAVIRGKAVEKGHLTSGFLTCRALLENLLSLRPTIASRKTDFLKCMDAPDFEVIRYGEMQRKCPS